MLTKKERDRLKFNEGCKIASEVALKQMNGINGFWEIGRNEFELLRLYSPYSDYWAEPQVGEFFRWLSFDFLIRDEESRFVFRESNANNKGEIYETKP